VPTAPSALIEALRDRYLLECELGRGGMATVYLARDLKHDRLVALKVLHPELAASLGPDRFEREIKLTARLDHPHILPVLDSGKSTGQLWYTMPYVRGESLRDRLQRETQLPVNAALDIARQVALALDYAHREGVVHRDLKPENILLAEGQARVADFGVAKAVDAAGGKQLTETGLSVGTPAYMSPEQASGGRVDARSDVYSLGAVLYEMLAGEPPYTGPSAQAVIAKRLSEPVPHLGAVRDVPPGLEAAVTKALAKVAADRFATAAEFAKALGAVETPAVAPRRRWPSLRVKLGIASVALAAVTGVVLRSYSHRHAALIRGTASAKEIRSIAVLPLVNVAGDSSQDYFSDGMTDELASALAKVPSLRVAARTSAFAFKGKYPEPAEVGSRLHVAAFLTGSVRRSGQALRVSVQVVDVRDGLTLWSDTYERVLHSAEDVFTVQDDIAKGIAEALALTLAGSPARTRNLEAHELYLRGRFFMNRWSEQDLRKSLQLYREALAKDSGYADAWAGIAAVWPYLADQWVAPREAYPMAKKAALRALELDSTVAVAHAVLSSVYTLYDWNPTAARREAQLALALDPSSADAWGSYGLILDAAGKPDSALLLYRRSESLDPLSAPAASSVCSALAKLGQAERAVGECRRALELDPNQPEAHYQLGTALVAAGHPEEAIGVWKQGPRWGDETLTAIARTEVALGRQGEGRRILGQLEAAAQKRYVAPDDIASIYLALGNRDAALRWLEQAYDVRSAGLAWIATNPIWAPLYSDPRFRALMSKLGAGTAHPRPDK
jgi:serine/threonine protein kinase/tetratricopeptide (TPR) repeat protein